MPDVVDYEADIIALRKEIEDNERQATTKRAAHDQMVAEMRASGVDIIHDNDAFTKVDEAGKEADQHVQLAIELRAKLDKVYGWAGEPAQRGKPKGGTGPGRQRETMGSRWTASDAYQALQRSNTISNDKAHINTGGAEVLSRDELKDFLRQRTTIDLTTGGAMIAPDFQVFPPIEKPIRRVLIVDLVDQTTTESDVVEYVLQTVRSNAAAPTAPGVPAPEEDFEFVLQTANVKDITSLVPAWRNVLKDQGQLEDLINSQLMASELLGMENQMVRGDGTGQNFTGIFNASGIATVTRGGSGAIDPGNGGANEYDMDALHRGITSVRLGIFDDPTGIGLHPSDEEKVVTQKDAQRRYIFDPSTSSDSLWGIPKVVTPVFTQGTGLVGNFKRGARLWLREGFSAMASTEHQDFFARRMVAILGLARAAFGVVLPASFAQVTSL